MTDPKRGPLASLIAASLVSGGGSVFVFDQVVAMSTDQLEAHVRTLEAEIADMRIRYERLDTRLDGCLEHLRHMGPGEFGG
jgi:hypothetical protein